MENTETFEGLPVYDAEMIDGKFTHGVNYVSLVEHPATKQPVFMFSDQATAQKQVILEDTVKLSVISEERGIIQGVLMLADTPILREVEGKKFYLRFPAKLVEAMAFKFMKNSFGQNINQEHSQETQLHDVYVVESRVFDPSRGHVLDTNLDAATVKPGSWIVTMKVEDQEIVKKIKDGSIVGYSLEGDFGIKVNFSESFVGIEKSIIFDTNISVKDKFDHIQKSVKNVG